jgi:hypothetical protein
MSKRLLLLGCLCLGSMVTPIRAADKRDILDDASQRLKIERQRIEKEIRAARADAVRLAEKGDKAAAGDMLRALVARLKDDTTLDESVRASLLRQVNLSLKDLPNYGKPLVDNSTARLIERDKRRIEADRKYYEDNRTKTDIEFARRMAAAGKGGDANRVIDDILKRDPNNVTAKAMRSHIGRANEAAYAKDFRERKASAFLLVMKGVDESSVKITDDIEYPKNWKELSEKRNKSTAQPLTPEEKKILKALDTPVDLDLKDVNMKEFLDHLKDKYGLDILATETNLKEAGVEYTTPVTIRGRATLRTLLRKALGDLNLTYIVKEQTVQVMTPARAREFMTTRSYYLGDLGFGPAGNQLLMTQTLVTIVNTIQSSIDPQSWEVNGGAGRIFFNPATMTLVVRQSAEVHYMLGNGIR